MKSVQEAHTRGIHHNGMCIKAHVYTMIKHLQFQHIVILPLFLQTIYQFMSSLYFFCVLTVLFCYTPPTKTKNKKKAFGYLGITLFVCSTFGSSHLYATILLYHLRN